MKTGEVNVSRFFWGWFVFVLVIRSRRPFFKNRPGGYLLAATLVVGATVLPPYTPLGAFFNFQPITVEFLLMIGLVLLLYIFSAELAKNQFYRRL